MNIGRERLMFSPSSTTFDIIVFSSVKCGGDSVSGVLPQKIVGCKKACQDVISGNYLKRDNFITFLSTICALREKRKRSDSVLWQNPYTHRTIQKATWQHKNATKNFDYTTIADRLGTVSWSNSSHPTGVVKPVYERSTFPLTATAV